MKILLLSGEESGKLYADMIRERLGAEEIRGYEDYGFSTGDLAVMGFWPVLSRLPFFIGVARTMKRAIRQWRPDVVCTVDYPGLNLKLAAYAKSLGIRTVHVVCPQVWAWKKGRVPKIERSVGKLCCFFPFEPAYFSPGFAEFVGHPLADGFQAAAAARERSTLALLPGSRVGEIEKILPLQLEAAKIVSQKVQSLQVVIPAANRKSRHAIERILDQRDFGFGIALTDGGARDLLCRATAAAVASGTATLEAALAGCPTVLVYKVGRLLGWFARLVIKGICHVGLANIIAEKADAPCPMPELLQDDFTPQALGARLEILFTDENARREAPGKLCETMKLLKSDGDAIGRIVDSLQIGTEK